MLVVTDFTVIAYSIPIWRRITIFLQIRMKLNQLHAVSRTQQGRQREPSVKTLRSPLPAEFWRHCVLSGRNQRRA